VGLMSSPSFSPTSEKDQRRCCLTEAK